MADFPGMLPYSAQLPPGQSAASLLLQQLGLTGIGGPTSGLGQMIAAATPQAAPALAPWLQQGLAAEAAQTPPPVAMQVGQLSGATPGAQAAQQPTGVTPAAMPELFQQMTPVGGGAVPETPDVAAEQQPMVPEQQQVAKSQWGQILSDPSVQAGLFQFGLSLTQPSWDSGAGKVFRGLGEGAEAAGRTYEGALAQEELGQKAAERQQALDISQERNQLSQQNMRLDYDAALRGQNISAGTAAEGRKNAIVLANIQQQGYNQRALDKSVLDIIEATELNSGEKLSLQEKQAIQQETYALFQRNAGAGAAPTAGVGAAAQAATPSTTPVRRFERKDGSIVPTQ